MDRRCRVRVWAILLIALVAADHAGAAGLKMRARSNLPEKGTVATASTESGETDAQITGEGGSGADGEDSDMESAGAAGADGEEPQEEEHLQHVFMDDDTLRMNQFDNLSDYVYRNDRVYKGKAQVIEGSSVAKGMSEHLDYEPKDEKTDLKAITHGTVNITSYVVGLVFLAIGVGMMFIARTGIYGEGQFHRTYGDDYQLTKNFRMDTEIATVVFFALLFLDITARVLTVALNYNILHSFHDNRDSSLDTAGAYALLENYFASMTLHAFVETQTENIKSISYANTRSFLKTIDKEDVERVDKAIDSTGNAAFDVPLTEDQWLHGELDTAFPDPLRVLVRFFYVDQLAATVLNSKLTKYSKKYGTSRSHEYEMSDEGGLLDIVYLFRMRSFKVQKMNEIITYNSFSTEIKDPDARVIPLFYFENGPDGSKIQTTNVVSLNYVKQELPNQMRKLDNLKVELVHLLRPIWRNVARYAHDTSIRDERIETIDASTGLINFGIIFVSLMPTVRTYLAADPLCAPVLDKDGTFINDARRHGPTKDEKAPTIYNGATWNCGSNTVDSPVAGDITCHLICKVGYTSFFSNTYCRNLGGAGTEWTHLLTVDGLPQSSTPLEYPGCCISDGTAGTLTNYQVENSDSKVKMGWSEDDGFPYGCGKAPTVQAHLCVVQDVVPVVDESYCDKACNDFGETVDTTKAKCFKSDNITYSDSVWSSGIDWSKDKTDGNFKNLNDAAVSKVTAGEQIHEFAVDSLSLPSGVSSGGDWKVLTRLVFTGSHVLPASSLAAGKWKDNEKLDIAF